MGDKPTRGHLQEVGVLTFIETILPSGKVFLGIYRTVAPGVVTVQYFAELPEPNPRRIPKKG